MGFQLTTGGEEPLSQACAADGPTLSYLAITRSEQADPTAGTPRDARFEAVGPKTVLQDRYRLDAELGRGAFGLVFLAYDQRLSREVAIKVVLPERLAAGHVGDLETLFTDEARLAASLHHPSIAVIHDYGFHQGLPYMVFEYVPGESLRDRLRRRTGWPIDEVRQFTLPVALALDYAHSRRVVHRDLKPENLRLTDQGEVKVLDLGLALRFDRTSNWRFAGTPAYAAPEQAAELPVDGRTDQYALAVIVYEMLTGRRPFRSPDPLALLEQHRLVPPTDPRQFAPHVSERVAAAVLRALDKDPAHRFASCKEFAAALGCAVPEGTFVEPDIVLEAHVNARSRLPLVKDQAHLTLTHQTLWVLCGEDVREVPIAAIERVRALWGGRTLELRFRTAGGRREWRGYDFRSRQIRDCWHDHLRQVVGSDATNHTASAQRRPRVMPIISPHQAVRYQALGQLLAAGPDREACEAGLRIRACMLDADAVILGDTAEALWTFSQETRRTLQMHRQMRSALFWPFSLAVALFRRMTVWGGEVGDDEAVTERASAVAVRAVDRSQRLALIGSSLRAQTATVGMWMLIALAGWFFLAQFWPIENERFVFLGARIVVYVAAWFLHHVPDWGPLLWPLVLALSLRIRKSGPLLAKSAVTLCGWGAMRGAALILWATRYGLPGRLWVCYALHLFFACALVVLAFAAWRLSRRFARLAHSPGLSAPLRLDLGAWFFTLLFLIWQARSLSDFLFQ